VNLILFEEHEADKPLPKCDERVVHLLKVLHKKESDGFGAGVLGLGDGKIEKINADDSLGFSLDMHTSPPQRLPVRVAVGFPQPVQIRRLLRDLSSLGVEAVDLVGMDLGEKSYRDNKLLDDGGARAALIEAGKLVTATVPRSRSGLLALRGLPLWAYGCSYMPFFTINGLFRRY